MIVSVAEAEPDGMVIETGMSPLGAAGSRPTDGGAAEVVIDDEIAGGAARCG